MGAARDPRVVTPQPNAAPPPTEAPKDLAPAPASTALARPPDPMQAIDLLGGAADPVWAVEGLANCRLPYLIGVRHHSPVLASAMPALLDAAGPDLLLVEMPEELQPWLVWLGTEDLE